MALFPDIRNGRASANAMTAGQQRQDVWLQAWQQRQKQNNPNTYNASWMPKEGWRGRFNQWQHANSQPHNPGQPQPPPGTPRVPTNTPGVPYAPPQPPQPPQAQQPTSPWRSIGHQELPPYHQELPPWTPGPQGASALIPKDRWATDDYYMPGYGPGEPGYVPIPPKSQQWHQPQQQGSYGTPRSNAMREY